MIQTLKTDTQYGSEQGWRSTSIQLGDVTGLAKGCAVVDASRTQTETETEEQQGTQYPALDEPIMARAMTKTIKLLSKEGEFEAYHANTLRLNTHHGRISSRKETWTDVHITNHGKFALGRDGMETGTWRALK